MAEVLLLEGAAPSTPEAGYLSLYAKTDSKLYTKNDTGTETEFGVGDGAGTVTSVSVTTANGVSGSVATDTTTPAITIALGDITPSSVVVTSGAVDLKEPGSTVTGNGVGLALIRFQGKEATSSYVTASDISVVATEDWDTNSHGCKMVFYVTEDGDDVSAIVLTLASDLNVDVQYGLNIGTTTARDTTITRVSAGVIAVGGVTIPSISSTNTLTNKRVSCRRGSTTSHATPTINTDNYDIYSLTAQAEAITSFTTNLTGTPAHGDALLIEITGTAARAITWGASFEASTIALPTTTVTTAMLQVSFLWNSTTSKWRCIGAA